MQSTNKNSANPAKTIQICFLRIPEPFLAFLPPWLCFLPPFPSTGTTCPLPTAQLHCTGTRSALDALMEGHQLLSVLWTHNLEEISSPSLSCLFKHACCVHDGSQGLKVVFYSAFHKSWIKLRAFRSQQTHFEPDQTSVWEHIGVQLYLWIYNIWERPSQLILTLSQISLKPNWIWICINISVWQLRRIFTFNYVWFALQCGSIGPACNRGKQLIAVQQLDTSSILGGGGKEPSFTLVLPLWVL